MHLLGGYCRKEVDGGGRKIVEARRACHAHDQAPDQRHELCQERLEVLIKLGGVQMQIVDNGSLEGLDWAWDVVVVAQRAAGTLGRAVGKEG